MTKRHLFIAAALAVSASVLTAATASATTMLSGQVNAAAAVNLLTNGDVFNEQFDGRANTDAWAAPSVRDLSATAAAAFAFGEDTGSAHSTASAHWDSADRGQVQFSDLGWTLHTPDADTADAVAGVANIGVPDWSYTFVADADGQFRLDFALTATGQTDGMGVWDLQLIDDGEVGFFNLFNLDEDEGFSETTAFRHALRAGHTYTVMVQNEDLHAAPFTPLQDVSGTESGTVNWSISATGAPEPSTWVLSLAGFGLAGAALRRRAVEKLA